MKKPGYIKVADRELRLISENYSSKMLLLWIPAVVFVLLAFVYQKGAVREIAVAVSDQDDTKLSRMLSRYVDASPDMRLTYYLGSEDNPETFFLHHPEKAIYHIPKGFEKSVMRGEQAQFQVLTNS